MSVKGEKKSENMEGPFDITQGAMGLGGATDSELVCGIAEESNKLRSSDRVKHFTERGLGYTI